MIAYEDNYETKYKNYILSFEQAYSGRPISSKFCHQFKLNCIYTEAWIGMSHMFYTDNWETPDKVVRFTKQDLAV